MPWSSPGVTTRASSSDVHMLAAGSSAQFGALSVWDLWETALMRRTASLLLLIWVLALVGCQPERPYPVSASGRTVRSTPGITTRSIASARLASRHGAATGLSSIWHACGVWETVIVRPAPRAR